MEEMLERHCTATVKCGKYFGKYFTMWKVKCKYSTVWKNNSLISQMEIVKFSQCFRNNVECFYIHITDNDTKTVENYTFLGYKMSLFCTIQMPKITLYVLKELSLISLLSMFDWAKSPYFLNDDFVRLASFLIPNISSICFFYEYRCMAI